MDDIQRFQLVLENTQLTPLTIKSYVSKYKRLLALLREPDMNSIALNIDNIGLLKSIYTNPNTLHSYFATILAYYKHMNNLDLTQQEADEIEDFLEIVNNTIEDLSIEIEEGITEITNKNELIHQIIIAKQLLEGIDLIIFRLFSELEPLGTELANVKIVYESIFEDLEQGNLLLMDKKKFVFNDHKNYFSQGPKIITIPNDLFNLIEAHILDNDKKFLFENQYKLPYNENSFSKLVKRTFLKYNINITIRQLQKLFKD